MKTRKTANIIINLIEEKYESDAVFERALGVPPKTVNNWKRGTSASFYKMLPEIAHALDVTPNYLLGFEERVLESEETELISHYRKAKNLSDADRHILLSTIKNVINLKIK